MRFGTIAAAVLLVAGLAVGADIQTITHGDRVDLEDHLVPGKYVLFDFYADWCGPCRQLDPQVKRLAESNAARLAVRKIDIVNWESEVSKQHRIQSIPHLKLYDPDGNLVTQGSGGQVLHTAQQTLGSNGGGGGVLSTPSMGPVIVFLAIGAAVLYLFVFSKKQPAVERGPSGDVPLPPPASAGGGLPDDPAEAVARVWLVEMQGSVEGPFTRDELERLYDRNQVALDSRTRRRGDRDWSRLGDVLG